MFAFTFVITLTEAIEIGAVAVVLALAAIFLVADKVAKALEARRRRWAERRIAELKEKGKGHHDR